MRNLYRRLAKPETPHQSIQYIVSLKNPVFPTSHRRHKRLKKHNPRRRPCNSNIHTAPISLFGTDALTDHRRVEAVAVCGADELQGRGGGAVDFGGGGARLGDRDGDGGG